jgi:hypothetical protein
MTPLVVFGVACVAGAGAKLWKTVGRTEYRQSLEQAFTRLLADDSQQVIPEKRLQITATARNLTAMRLRENRSEILAFANLIATRGYTRTSKALRECVKEFES